MVEGVQQGPVLVGTFFRTDVVGSSETGQQRVLEKKSGQSAVELCGMFQVNIRCSVFALSCGAMPVCDKSGNRDAPPRATHMNRTKAVQD